ncbi:hypothetical protein SISSUDRAFT_196611 [Sistotremastrum suecicum HHB10207 ss-3]|uniref:Uncharacterized protein n=1 Tax=Sistotremastrum suecicum HHB10207 ss-3 TaxID=1314776 RepID=A0A166ADD6_9AGAM|nr:hypothetical protein SISSUDRAFT_196611 [Sistotremastrum suecicum HHB10207 ss-3]
MPTALDLSLSMHFLLSSLHTLSLDERIDKISEWDDKIKGPDTVTAGDDVHQSMGAKASVSHHRWTSVNPSRLTLIPYDVPVMLFLSSRLSSVSLPSCFQEVSKYSLEYPLAASRNSF